MDGNARMSRRTRKGVNGADRDTDVMSARLHGYGWQRSAMKQLATLDKGRETRSSVFPYGRRLHDAQPRMNIEMNEDPYDNSWSPCTLS
jgi:hypothetical protein